MVGSGAVRTVISETTGYLMFFIICDVHKLCLGLLPVLDS